MRQFIVRWFSADPEQSDRSARRKWVQTVASVLLVTLVAVGIQQYAETVRAASFTSVRSGNWSDPGTWSGAVVPADGDVVIIATGHTITIDQNTTVGSTTGTAYGILINGTSPTNYGRLVVNSGVTLTLRGVSRTYHAMKVNRYGQFNPLPGSTVQVNATADGSTGILVEGLIDARGTAETPVVFTVPPANRNWNAVQNATTVPTQAAAWPYDEDKNIAVVTLPRTRISNASGTGIGSIADSSLVISGQVPTTIAQTQVNTLDEVNAAGEYYVDYATGLVYFYHLYPNGNPRFNVSFRYLDISAANWRGWYIDLGASNAGGNNDVTYNEGWFDHAVFEYMGSMGSFPLPAIRAGYKRTPSVEPNRNFYVTNSVWRWGAATIRLRGRNIGTASDPLLIDNNQFWQSEYGSSQTAGINVSLHTTANTNISHLTISNNEVHSRNFVDAGSYAVTNAHDHIRIVNNTQTGGVSFFFDVTPPSYTLGDSEISGNILDGVGSADGYTRGMLDMRGATGYPLVIRDNIMTHWRSAIGVNRDTVIEQNVFGYSYLSAINGGSGFSGYAPDVMIRNNLFYGRGSRRTTAPAYETYSLLGAIDLHIPNVGDRAWFDNWNISNNTFANIRRGALNLGDISGASQAAVSVFTKLQFTNNLVVGGEYAVQRKVDTSIEIARGAMSFFDYNLFYNQSVSPYANIHRAASFLLGSDQYNLLASPARNVTGVELWNPSTATNQSARNLTLAVNTLHSDETLQWGTGTPQPLVWQSPGALSANATKILQSWGISTQFLMTDTTRSWSTAANTAGNPRGKWVKFTSGANAGSIFAVMSNAPTTLTLSPVPTTLPLAGDTYAIYNAQVVLPDGVGGTIEAGIDLRYLPTTSLSDAGITVVVDRTQTGNPQLVNPVGQTASDYQLTDSSAGLEAGTTINAPSSDYWGTLRPQGSGIDIGFHELGGVTTSITLTKTVINNNGGNATVNDFGLSIGGQAVTSGQILPVVPNAPIALTEAGLAGYAFVSLTGDPQCPTALGGTVTLNEGERITCIITNDDIAPTITLTKNVINDNGGTAGPNDFGLSIGGTPVNSGEILAVSANTAYALNEAGRTGYAFVSLTGDPVCPSALNGTVTLDEGQNVACTITNDDLRPQLTVIKHVVNADGGSATARDFTMQVSGMNVSLGSFPGDESGTAVFLDPGAYSVDETVQNGYAGFFSGECDGTIGIGEQKTCTITNYYIAPNISRVKTTNLICSELP